MTNNEKFMVVVSSKNFNFCPVCTDGDFNILESESGRYVYCANCDTCLPMVFMEDSQLDINSEKTPCCFFCNHKQYLPESDEHWCNQVRDWGGFDWWCILFEWREYDS